MHFVPGRMNHFRPWIEEGFERAKRRGVDKNWQDFEIIGQCPVQITDDVTSVFRKAKDNIALYTGGMGHKDVNFHNQHMVQRVIQMSLSGSKSFIWLAVKKRPPSRFLMNTLTRQAFTALRTDTAKVLCSGLIAV